jgi:hypothetical protein
LSRRARHGTTEPKDQENAAHADGSRCVVVEAVLRARKQTAGFGAKMVHGPLRSFVAPSFICEFGDNSSDDSESYDVNAAGFLDSILNGPFLKEMESVEDIAVKRLNIPQKGQHPAPLFDLRTNQPIGLESRIIED